MNGYVKLFRKMESWGWYTDIPTKTLFLHLLIKANFYETEFLGHKIERGQLATSLPRLAEETGLSVQQVRTALKKLESTHEINRQATGKFTVITVEKYSLYQADDIESNREITENQQASNIQSTGEQQHIKNNKNNKTNTQKEKLNKKKKGSEVDELIDEQPIALQDALRDFVKMRASIKKPMTTKRAMKQLLNRLYKLSDSDIGKANHLLNEAILHNWQSVYEIKSEPQKPRNEVLDMIMKGELDG